MKTVVSNSMVAHLWAAQSQTHARSDSMRFAGPTLYSYQTPIANIVERIKGAGRVALITSESYSITTSSKHMPAARRAVSHYQTFTVPYLGVSCGRAVSEWHKANALYLVEQYHKRVGQYCRELSNWDSFPEEARREYLKKRAQEVADYCYAFDVLITGSIDAAADFERIKATRMARDARRNAPGYDEKRRKAREQREAAAARKREREIAERVMRDAERIAQWRAGSYVPSLHGSLHGLPITLRLSRDGLNVETSHGAEVPIADARMLLRLVESVRGNGGFVDETRGDVIKVGAFRLREIATNGDTTIGCHSIKWDEIERFKELLK